MSEAGGRALDDDEDVGACAAGVEDQAVDVDERAGREEA
jgi:hypothetical protein